MYATLRKASAIILIALVSFFTGISILAIWDIIKVEHIFTKTLSTLLILFAASAIMLFIFAVLFKSDADKERNSTTPNP